MRKARRRSHALATRVSTAAADSSRRRATARGSEGDKRRGLARTSARAGNCAAPFGGKSALKVARAPNRLPRYSTNFDIIDIKLYSLRSNACK